MGVEDLRLSSLYVFKPCLVHCGTFIRIIIHHLRAQKKLCASHDLQRGFALSSNALRPSHALRAERP